MLLQQNPSRFFTGLLWESKINSSFSHLFQHTVLWKDWGFFFGSLAQSWLHCSTFRHHIFSQKSTCMYVLQRNSFNDESPPKISAYDKLIMLYKDSLQKRLNDEYNPKRKLAPSHFLHCNNKHYVVLYHINVLSQDFATRAKLAVQNMVQRVGFLGILACASVSTFYFCYKLFVCVEYSHLWKTRNSKVNSSGGFFGFFCYTR